MSMPEEAIQAVVASRSSVADKIRALNAGGLSRAAIARALNKRYQHVRNVLEADNIKRSGLSGVRETGAAFESAPTQAIDPTRIGNLVRFVVGPDGVIKLPAPVLEAWNLKPGRIVIGLLADDELTLLSPSESIRRAQAMSRPWRPGEPMASEELIEERRREAAEESRRD